MWTIYLADRIHDGRRIAGTVGTDPPAAPPRHAWGRRHRRVLIGLAAVAALGLAASLSVGLAPETIRAGCWAAAGTALYYALFRGARRFPGRLRRLPAKEFGIALPFAFGVATAATSGSPWELPPLLLLSFVLLVAGNCLLIARAEREWDQVADASAFYSQGVPQGGPSAKLPEGLLCVSLAVGLLECLRSPGDGALALSLCAAATLALAAWKGEAARRHAQPIADGLHLLAWLVPALTSGGLALTGSQ